MNQQALFVLGQSLQGELQVMGLLSCLQEAEQGKTASDIVTL